MKYVKNGLFFVLFLSILVVAVPAQSQFYISPNGNDANPGTVDAPWATIGHAVETVNAGDTVYIRNGVYYEHVRISNNGNAGAYIVFSGYPGENPVIDGSGVTESENGIVVDGSYIRLSGLEIRNWNENGIWVEQAAYIDISDCRVHDVTYGVGLADGTHDFVLNGVEMYNFEYYGFDASPSGGEDCYNGVLIDCTAHDWRNPGLIYETDGFAFSHEGNQHGFTLDRCTAYNVGDGFDLGGRDITATSCTAEKSKVGFKLWGDAITLEECISSGNEASNMELDWDGTPGTTTLRQCRLTDSGIYNIWIENSRDTLHMYNCVLAGGDTLGLAFEMRDIGNYEGDYNVFHNNDPDRVIVVGYEDEFSLSRISAGDWTAYSGQDSHSKAADSMDEALSGRTLPNEGGQGTDERPENVAPTAINRQNWADFIEGLIDGSSSGGDIYEPGQTGNAADIGALILQHGRERDHAGALRDLIGQGSSSDSGNTVIENVDDIEYLVIRHDRERDDMITEALGDMIEDRSPSNPGQGETGSGTMVQEFIASRTGNRNSIISSLLGNE